MEQIAYILFGWLLGLLSPTIIAKINTQYTKKQYFKAVCTELHDLQYRVAIVSFLLGQRYGKIDNDFLQWIQPFINGYKGSEPNVSVSKLINSMLSVEENEFNTMIEHMRAEPDSGLGLKTFTVSFLESNIGMISQLPLELQSKIHEFRNHLNTLNQEIRTVTERLKMTFDSSISDENHKRLTDDLRNKYGYIQKICQRVVIKIEAVQSSTI